ncbi:MAG: sodium:solute symporter family protein [Akkermansiaceae bacterium]
MHLADSSNHMTAIDWLVVAAWVLGTSFFGFWFSKHVKTARDYLVAGRKLKWWQIGIAQAADSVDAGDFIAIAGMAYLKGFTGLGYIWIGMTFGTYLLARYLAPMLYRSGVLTNAEFLEIRFTPSMRIASALIQILYRFIALALVGYALATMFRVVMGVEMTYGIFISMTLTVLYVHASGQLGVVMAAIPQVGLMLLVSGIVFYSVFSDLGGVQGFKDNLPDYQDMLHLTFFSEDGINPSVYLVGLILVLFTYPLVNQTVAQRIVSASSESDARKGSIISLLPWFIVTGVAILAGVVGNVLVPDLPADSRNDLYPLYIVEYLPTGVLGLGVAALVVGSMSTGAGIGTAISGLLANDVFGIMGKEEMGDARKLALTRLFSTSAIVLGSLLSSQVSNFGGMVPFYTTFSGTFVLPLTVPYLAAAFFPSASRHSALASLVAGCLVGLVLFNAVGLLPASMTHPQCRPFWVLGTAIVVMILWSLIENRMKGPIPKNQLAARFNAFDFGRSLSPQEIQAMIQNDALDSWGGKANLNFDTLGLKTSTPWFRHPGFYENTILILIIALMVLLW